MICKNIYKDKRTTRVFRELDDDPAYAEIVEVYVCQRDMGHGGDHKGPMMPPEDSITYPNKYAIWPPANFRDPLV